jgi:hypothetical protein
MSKLQPTACASLLADLKARVRAVQVVVTAAVDRELIPCDSKPGTLKADAKRGGTEKGFRK